MSRPLDCSASRRAMLSAETEELRGHGDGRLAAHVRSCPACAGAARAVLEATGSLDAWLDAPGPPPRVEDLLARDGAGGARMRRIRPAAGRRMALRLAPWFGLAAAAALAAVLMRPPPPPTPHRAASEPESLPLVQDAGGRSVAVLETADPNITLVWFF